MSPKTKPEKIWKPMTDDKNVIFVRSDLDDYGLDVYEFRVLGHIARREGKKKDGTAKGCFAKQKTIAEVCSMSHRKAQDVLRILCEIGMIEKEVRQGTTNVYKLTLPSTWKDPSKLSEIRKKNLKIKKGNTSDEDSDRIQSTRLSHISTTAKSCFNTAK
ncbi:helix-turn-helix domain-containing protein [Nodularia harveyana UHCC-0300]|uniref:Helix-turn-helix domain-containing protein n=1 Tax=Nodularia harveyana UHCC-0300 TaxID=2974287 RepID=A0ABU5UHU9_9CYAN|nr:helix-turn-helix domain-containing protein [Nodularia harveyana]MEA5583121.1 helix-turn-helix domain-containing protein [Nodularia harveyana UHCC-0300]